MDPAGGALVVQGNQAERSQFVEDRLAVERIGDENARVPDAPIEFAGKKTTLYMGNQRHNLVPPACDCLALNWQGS